MTLSDIHTYITLGLNKYETGGAGYQITSGIIHASYYEDFEKYVTAGMIVYGYVGRGVRFEETDSVISFNQNEDVWLHGRVNGNSDENESNILKMTDDLIKVLVVGDETGSSDVSGRISYDWHSEPLVDKDKNTARVIIHGTAQYMRKLL
jgi:hypothetical protein